MAASNGSTAITAGIYLVVMGALGLAAARVVNDGNQITVDHSVVHRHEHYHQHYWPTRYLHLLGPSYHDNYLQYYRNWLLHRQGKVADGKQAAVFEGHPGDYRYGHDPHKAAYEPKQTTANSPPKQVNRDRVEFLKAFLAPFLGVASGFG